MGHTWWSESGEVLESVWDQKYIWKIQSTIPMNKVDVWGRIVEDSKKLGWISTEYKIIKELENQAEEFGMLKSEIESLKGFEQRFLGAKKNSTSVRHVYCESRWALQSTFGKAFCRSKKLSSSLCDFLPFLQLWIIQGQWEHFGIFTTRQTFWMYFLTLISQEQSEVNIIIPNLHMKRLKLRNVK